MHVSRSTKPFTNHDKFNDLFTTVTKMSRVLPQGYKCIGNKLCW